MADVNKTVLQPYITRHFKNGWATNPEYTFDWMGHQDGFPINLTFSKVITLIKHPLVLPLAADIMSIKCPKTLIEFCAPVGLCFFRDISKTLLRKNKSI